MVVNRAVLLPVGRVERIRHRHVRPAGVLFCLADARPVLGGYYIEDHIVALIRLEIERHAIIHLAFRQPHVDGSVDLAIDKHDNPCVVVRFLHGKQKIPAVACDSDESIVYSEMVDFNSFRGGCRKSREECPEHHEG